jgi:hypothetical protein
VREKNTVRAEDRLKENSLRKERPLMIGCPSAFYFLFLHLFLRSAAQTASASRALGLQLCTTMPGSPMAF